MRVCVCEPSYPISKPSPTDSPRFLFSLLHASNRIDKWMAKIFWGCWISMYSNLVKLPFHLLVSISQKNLLRMPPVTYSYSSWLCNSCSSLAFACVRRMVLCG